MVHCVVVAVDVVLIVVGTVTQEDTVEVETDETIDVLTNALDLIQSTVNPSPCGSDVYSRIIWHANCRRSGSDQYQNFFPRTRRTYPTGVVYTVDTTVSLSVSLTTTVSTGYSVSTWVIVVLEYSVIVDVTIGVSVFVLEASTVVASSSSTVEVIVST